MSPSDYIDLWRRFRDLANCELEATEVLASFNDHDGSGLDWSELLKHRRVLILAEAGSGKTREMVERVQRLTAEGKFAFFLPLESLDRDKVEDLLSARQQTSYATWKVEGCQSAWFFLDAVDELKLTGGKLDRALVRFANAIDGHLDRAHIVISCRPHDWRPQLDLATVQNRLPLSAKPERKAPASEDLFVDALRRERGAKVSNGAEDDEHSAYTSSVRVVILLPLSNRQIVLYAEHSGVLNVKAFLGEVERQNAWDFARRPLDLADLVAIWTSAGHLGTRAQQFEANVTAKLRDHPDRPDTGRLSDAKGRLGAERLALAMTLTRTRTIRSPEQLLQVDEAGGILDAAHVLQDWTEEERQTLLRRALFDPATYGRVRFHHRSVQEYLAARHLKTLRDKGMSIKALFRLIVAERYGVKVVIPSMRPIAAWLALWEDAVRRDVAEREPEVLLTLGDPESLPLSVRADLLRAFAAAYGQGGGRGLNVPIAEVRRLAHLDLAPTIRQLWGTGPANADVCELLIEVIWQGAVADCVDIARAAALNFDYADYIRIASVRALLACGDVATVRCIATDMLVNPGSWPEKVAQGVAEDLFPAFLSVSDFIVLMERMPDTNHRGFGFGWVARQIAETIDLSSPEASALRDGLADLIWRGRYAENEWYRIRSRFDCYNEALSLLCTRQLEGVAATTNTALIHASVIAARFGEHDGYPDPVKELRAKFHESEVLRKEAFWAELAFMDAYFPVSDDWGRLWHVLVDGSLIDRLGETDRLWLEGALTDESHPDRQGVALQVLCQNWHANKRGRVEMQRLQAVIKGKPALEAILAARTAPQPRDSELIKTERNRRNWEKCDTARKEADLRSWKTWREKLLADPDGAFAADKVQATIASLYSWVDAERKARNRRAVWNREAITQAFGVDIADRSAQAMGTLWRANPPVLWSDRAPEQRICTPNLWIWGLCGVSDEASTLGWASHLTSAEARIASAYATIEINGLPPFITDLALVHPADVDAVLGGELTAQLGIGGDASFLPLLQALSHADRIVKNLLSPHLIAALSTWPTTITQESEACWVQHLDQVLGILKATCAAADRPAIAEICWIRHKAEPTGPLALVWLKGLCWFDPEQAVEAVVAALPISPSKTHHEGAESTFASLFGNRDPTVLAITDPTRRAQALARLLRIAYAFIQPQDDQVHDGVYSPNDRDDAETARNFLLSALLDTPGAETCRLLRDLASEPEFGHFADRLRLLARHRAASDSEYPAYDDADVVALENRYEAPPHDRDGMFSIMQDRLDDLAHDIAHHDFTDRRTLRTIGEEIEMQRTLALRLQAKANGTFTVTREDEVADLKRTDIRLSAVRGHQKGVIEVKLADQRWSLSDLERALRDQLVGQYLRHEHCKAGCLLLTYNGEKKYWKRPTTQERLNFTAMVAFLNEQASALESEHHHSIKLAVYGLDLTDPALAPAHRSA